VERLRDALPDGLSSGGAATRRTRAGRRGAKHGTEPPRSMSDARRPTAHSLRSLATHTVKTHGIRRLPKCRGGFMRVVG
jgi:hypothetical protein